LAAVVAEVVRELSPLVQGHIQTDVCIPDGLWPVAIPTMQIKELLTKLSLHAREVCGRHGSLSVAAYNRRLEQPAFYGSVKAHSGAYVVLKVGHSGPSIPVALRQRLFDPCLLGKAAGSSHEGGLAEAFALVRAYGGFVDFAEDNPAWTEWHVYLPADGSGVQGTPAAEAPPGTSSSRCVSS
jgi:nitrogen-specific signal transduction histidine kinase